MGGYLYARGLAFAATGKVLQAKETLTQLEKSHPKHQRIMAPVPIA
jgi:hypothetical protein